MRLNQLTKRRAYPVIKGLFTGVFFSGCSPAQHYTKQEESLAYKVINLHTFKDNALFYKTASFMPYMEKQCFNFNCINRYNAKESPVLENKRYVDFDTIFNKDEQKTIETKLRALKSREIDPLKLNNPHSLSKERINSGKSDSLRGYNTIMFPVIQKNKKGDDYAFFYKSWSVNSNGEGNLYIYKKVEEDWRYVCIVPVFIE